MPFQCLVGPVRQASSSGGGYVSPQASAIVTYGTVSPQYDGYICIYSIVTVGPYHISVGIGTNGGSMLTSAPQEIMGSPMSLLVQPAEADPDYYVLEGADANPFHL